MFRPLRRKRSRKCLPLLRSSELKLPPQPIEVCHSDNQLPQLFLFSFSVKGGGVFFRCQGGETHQLQNTTGTVDPIPKRKKSNTSGASRDPGDHYMTAGPQTSYTKVRGKSLQMTGATFAATSLIYKAISIRISGNMKSWAWDFLLAQNDEMVKTWEKKRGFLNRKKTLAGLKKTKCIL